MWGCGNGTGKMSKREAPEYNPSRKQMLQEKLISIAAVTFEPGVGDGTRFRKEILASLIAKGYDPSYVADAFDVPLVEFKAWEREPGFQESFKVYRDRAHAAPDKALELARASSLDIMGDVVRTAHTADDPNAVLTAAKVVLSASKVSESDRPTINFNLSKQEIALIVDGLMHVPSLPEVKGEG